MFGSAQQQSVSVADKVKTFTPFVKNSIFSNPFRGSHKTDFIIFDHPRKVLFKNEYRDIYSYFLIDLLKDYSFEVMEAPYLNNHYSPKKNYIKYTDRIQLGSYMYKKSNNIEYEPGEMSVISTVKREIKNRLDLDIDIESIMTQHILNYQYDYKRYMQLFEKRNPKKIFVVVAYENQAIVSAAKDLNIEVIELQHGTITDYHLGYSYPLKTRRKGEIKYFPDKILTFGEYWINDETCPISKENIIPVGFSYFQEQSKKFKNISANDKQILFISQGVIGKYLSALALKAAEKLPDYNIIYKLHPGEYETWKNYDDLVKASKLENVKVIDNSEIELYQLFAQSEYQIGAFSTAIYEGLMFNCKTFILDVPGIEYLNDLIDDGYVYKINDADDLVENLEKFTPKEYDENFFFKNFDEKLFNKVIDE